MLDRILEWAALSSRWTLDLDHITIADEAISMQISTCQDSRPIFILT